MLFMKGEMKMNKKNVLFSIFIFIILTFLPVSIKSEAAASRILPIANGRVKIKGRYYWIEQKGKYQEIRRSKTKKGTGTSIVREPSASDRIAGITAVTDGRYLHYGTRNIRGRIVQSTNDSGLSTDNFRLNSLRSDISESNHYQLYRCDLDGSNQIYLGNINHAAKIAGYYKNEILMTVYKDINSYGYRFNIKTGKSKKITSNFKFDQHYNKFFLGQKLYGNDFTNSYQIYNAETKKLKTLSKKCFAVKQIKNNIYYAEILSSGWNDKERVKEYKFQIKKYNCITGRIKTLSKALVTTDISGDDKSIKITSKSMNYLYKKTTYKYVYKTKKSNSI